MALATAVSAVVLFLLLRPGAMLQAIRHADGPASAEWSYVQADLRRMMRTASWISPQGGLFELLDSLTALEHGKPLEASDTKRLQESLDRDRANLVSRIAFACINDAEPSKPDAPRPSPLDRFHAFKRTIDSSEPAKIVALYNQVARRSYYEIVRPYVYRPDVAISFADSSPIRQMYIAYAALPEIQLRLQALATALDESGHTDEAAQCRRWIADMAFGLIKTEPDASTRLLCVDLLERSLDPQQSAAVEALRRLQADFHAHADASPVDRADQSVTGKPSVAPEPYRWAIDALMLTIVLVLFSGGAALFAAALIAGAMLSSLITRLRDIPMLPGLPPLPRLAGHQWAIAMLIPLVAAGLLNVQTHERGLPSIGWGLAVAILAMICAALAATFLAAWSAGMATPRPPRSPIIAALPLIALLILLALPSRFIVRVCHRMETTGAIIAAAVVLGLVLVTVAVWAARVRWLQLVRAATVIWLMSMSLALAAYASHFTADRWYQDIVTTYAFDDVAARLGPNWQDRYLEPARKAFGIKADREAASGE